MASSGSEYEECFRRDNGRIRLWPGCRCSVDIFRGVTGEVRGTPQGSRSACWDLKPGRFEYEAGVATTRDFRWFYLWA
jgi:hypothetical protein